MGNHIDFALHARTDEVRARIEKRWINLRKTQISLDRQRKEVEEMEQAFQSRLEDRGEYYGPGEDE